MCSTSLVGGSSLSTSTIRNGRILSCNEQVVFNQMLRSALNQIECAFGRLKARWRILSRPMDIPVEYLPNVIFGCFVLHNYCERRKCEVDTALVEQVILEERKYNPKIDKSSSYNTPLGKRVRETIADYFKEYL